MSDERCENCRFYGKNDDKWGFCRRYAPRLAPGDSGANAVFHIGAIDERDYIEQLKHRADWARWPATTKASWCGEFAAKEEKK
jgi:hypothetical protein